MQIFLRIPSSTIGLINNPLPNILYFLTNNYVLRLLLIRIQLLIYLLLNIISVIIALVLL